VLDDLVDYAVFLGLSGGHECIAVHVPLDLLQRLASVLGVQFVQFLTGVPDEPDWQALEEVKRKSERFALRGDVFYFFAPEGFHLSKIGPWLKRSFGDVDGTGRTWSTVVKVMDMAKAME